MQLPNEYWMQLQEDAEYYQHSYSMRQSDYARMIHQAAMRQRLYPEHFSMIAYVESVECQQNQVGYNQPWQI